MTADFATSKRDGHGLGSQSSAMVVLLPYAIAIGAQLPLLMLYFADLWKRTHYQFFPIAIILTVYLAFTRWPRNVDRPFFSNTFSSVCMVTGLVFGVAGVMFVFPWFTAVSVLVLVTSLFARTVDNDSQRSLLPCALPMLTCLYLPGGLDSQIIGWLQYLSATFTSRLLDLLGYVHHMPGTVITAATGEQFGIAEACSGVVSFHTLVFAAIALCVLQRRPWFRATLLVISAGFWAVFINTVRIMAIPLADWMFELNLSEGILHEVLGYSMMLVGVLLLLSTDQFIFFMFGPAEEFGEDSGGLGRRVSRFWNSVISGGNSGERVRTRKRLDISPIGRSLTWGVAGILLLGGLWSLTDVFRSWNASGDLKVRFFDLDVTTVLNEGDLPAVVDNWERKEFEAQDHGHGSDLGRHSDRWQYVGPKCAMSASLDQAFPGWHELTTCYRNQGWKLVSRMVVTPSGDEFGIDGKPWQMVVAEFERETGERAYLVFSLFDAFGQPFDPPGDWGMLKSFLIRASNRLSNRIRANLFQGDAYQTQIFLVRYGVIPDDIKEEAVARYLVLREQMRKRFLEKKSGGSSPNAGVETAN